MTARYIVQSAYNDALNTEPELKYRKVVIVELNKLLVKLDKLEEKNEFAVELIEEIKKLPQPFKLGELWNHCYGNGGMKWHGQYSNISNTLKTLCEAEVIRKISRGTYELCDA